jgi:homoserine dehydrogenase
MNIAIVGFGNVGRGLAQILLEKDEYLRTRYGFAPRVVAVSTRIHGTLYDPKGLNLRQALDDQLSVYPASHSLSRAWKPNSLAATSVADVIVEATPTDLETGGDALEICRIALKSSKHVVTVNKGPIALAYPELRDLASTNHSMMLFEGTVMAGTPALRMAEHDLAGSRIQAVRGVLNGTTNYILTQMETGMSYDDALAQAQELGYAESDPAGDVDGWDAAAKVMILCATVFGQPRTLDEIDVTGISGISADDIAQAAEAGERWKLIAQASAEGGSVRPVRLPVSDPLASVSGAANAITYETDMLGPVTLTGPGAGPRATGFALLADLLTIHRMWI